MLIQHASWTWRLGERFQVVDGEVGRKLPPSPIKGNEPLYALCPKLITLHVPLSELELRVIIPAVLVVLPSFKGLTTVWADDICPLPGFDVLFVGQASCELRLGVIPITFLRLLRTSCRSCEGNPKLRGQRCELFGVFLESETNGLTTSS